jgi:hypothetical protein
MTKKIIKITESQIKDAVTECVKNVLSEMNTSHFNNDMEGRLYIINNILGGEGKVVLTNVIDRGHRNGPERFELTDKGIINVYNEWSGRRITVLFARIGQLYSRFGGKFEKLPLTLQMDIKAHCQLWQERGYNEI